MVIWDLPVCGQTDTAENVTFPELRWQAVKSVKSRNNNSLYCLLLHCNRIEWLFFQSGTCTLREAVIVSSVLTKNSIPMLHSAAAILKIAEMDYNGANSIFLRTLLDKKYALPFRVVDALVFHFLRLVQTDITVKSRFWNVIFENKKQPKYWQSVYRVVTNLLLAHLNNRQHWHQKTKWRHARTEIGQKCPILVEFHSIDN